MTDVEIGGLCALSAFVCAVIAFAHALAAPAPTRKEPDMPQSDVSTPPAAKQTTQKLSRLASKILRDKSYRPKVAEIRALAACVLGQDETPAPKAVKKRGAR